MTLIKNHEFTQIIEEIAKISDDMESECINQTHIPSWKLKLQFSGIKALVDMAEQKMLEENEKRG